MKSLLLIVSLFALHSTSFAHQYYFGFAEVEYDFFSQRFEATPAGDLEALDSVQSVIVEDYINASFKINSNGSKCDFTLIGHDTELNGKINFYLESSEIAIEGIIDVEIDILMDNYQEQQNKITLYYIDQTYTLAFTRGNKKQTIQIVNLQE